MGEETVFCPDCNAENPAGARFCNGCGRTLDLVGHMVDTHLTDRRARMAQQKEGMAALKEAAEQASQERMGRWWQEENKRREHVARTQARKRKQERTLLIIVIVGVVIVLALILVVALVANPSGGGPIDPAPTSIIPW